MHADREDMAAYRREKREALSRSVEKRSRVARRLVAMFWTAVTIGLIVRAAGAVRALELIAVMAVLAAIGWGCLLALGLFYVVVNDRLVHHFMRAGTNGEPGAPCACQRAELKAKRTWIFLGASVATALVMWAYGPGIVLGHVALAIFMTVFAVSAIVAGVWPTLAVFVFILGGTLLICAANRSDNRRDSQSESF